MRYRFYFLFLSIGILITYSNAPAGDFTPEDKYLIAENDFIKDFSNAKLLISAGTFFSPVPIVNGARPATVFSLMADHLFWGERALGYRIKNIFLHILNVCLIFTLFKFLGSGREFSFFTAFLFGVHPVNAEVVNVPGFRSELLVSIFFLSSFMALLYLYRNPQPWLKNLFYLLASAFLFFIALLSKETAVMLPVLLLVLSGFGILKKSKKPGFRFTIYNMGMLAVSFVYILTFWIRRYSYDIFDTFFVSITGGVNPAESLLTYLNTIFITFFIYIRNIFLPFFLSYEYQITVDRLNLASILGFLLISSFIYLVFKLKDKKLKLSMLFFIITYIPASNIIPLHNTVSDRYLYLPLAGGIYFVSRLLYTAFRAIYKGPRKIFGMRHSYILGLSLIVFFHLLSFNRNFLFANTLKLYENASRYAPDNPRVNYNLGLAYSVNGFHEKSNQVLSGSLSRHPLYQGSRAWHVKARNYFMLGYPEKSAEYLKKVILIKPSPEIISELVYVLESGEIKSF